MSPRERNMLIVLGVVAVAGLAYLFLFVLGGDEPAEQTAPTPVTSPPPVPAEPGTGVGEPGAEPPRATTFFGGRDPFVPLVVATDPTAGGTTTGDTTTGDTTDGDTTDGDTTDGDTDDGPVEPPADGSEGDGDGISVTGRQVVLIDIVDEDTVQVEIDGETFTVNVGETFSRNFKLVSVSGGCARFLFGDESFTLCEEGAAPK